MDGAERSLAGQPPFKHYGDIPSQYGNGPGRRSALGIKSYPTVESTVR